MERKLEEVVEMLDAVVFRGGDVAPESSLS